MLSRLYIEYVNVYRLLLISRDKGEDLCQRVRVLPLYLVFFLESLPLIFLLISKQFLNTLFIGINLYAINNKVVN